MRSRLNRSLSSVKSLAPCFIPLRVRHTSAYDFICRHCGEVLQPEQEAFSLLDLLSKACNTSDGDAQFRSQELDRPHAIRDMLAELEGVRTGHRGSL